MERYNLEYTIPSTTRTSDEMLPINNVHNSKHFTPYLKIVQLANLRSNI